MAVINYFFSHKSLSSVCKHIWPYDTIFNWPIQTITIHYSRCVTGHLIHKIVCFSWLGSPSHVDKKAFSVCWFSTNACNCLRNLLSHQLKCFVQTGLSVQLFLQILIAGWFFSPQNLWLVNVALTSCCEYMENCRGSRGWVDSFITPICAQLQNALIAAWHLQFQHIF